MTLNKEKFWNSLTKQWQDPGMNAVEYYERIGINLNKIKHPDRETIGSFFLDDFLWTKEELVEKYGKDILINKKLCTTKNCGKNK